ncbi:unnamed protein product [Amoebophrya sp. A120]|nr:unnamed protein product [Amoebophrya sp. A120]|eukprot:GSA120T00002830001.1
MFAHRRGPRPRISERGRKPYSLLQRHTLERLMKSLVIPSISLTTAHSQRPRPFLLPISEKLLAIMPLNNRQPMFFAVGALLLASPEHHVSAATAGPIMGWMSWERFRCETNCAKFPQDCIQEKLYYEMADALVETGLAAAGYAQVSIDDCWTKGRDETTKELRADPDRFPTGIPKLADYLHAKSLKLGIYSDAGKLTCGGYIGSRGSEELDAKTFYDWGVDYLKLDGCYIDTPAEMTTLYTKFGLALEKEYEKRTSGSAKDDDVASTEDKDEAYRADSAINLVGRRSRRELSPVISKRPKIVYSCSWPAYLGDDEREKPYQAMREQAKCDTWRNWADIDNSVGSLKGIVNHWAIYTKAMEAVPANALNDPDMILAGNDHYGTVLPIQAAKLQLAVWAVVKAPLFLSADIRKFVTEKNKYAPYVTALKDELFLSVVKSPSTNIGGCVFGCGELKGKREPGTVSLSISMPFVTRADRQISKDPSDLQIWFRKMGAGVFALAFVNLDEKQGTKVSLRIDRALKDAMVEAWNKPAAASSDDHGEVDHSTTSKSSSDGGGVGVAAADVLPPEFLPSTTGSVAEPVTWSIALDAMEGRLFVGKTGNYRVDEQAKQEQVGSDQPTLFL